MFLNETSWTHIAGIKWLLFLLDSYDRKFYNTTTVNRIGDLNLNETRQIQLHSIHIPGL